MTFSLRRFSTALFASAMLAAVPFEAAMAQGGPIVGAPGGVSQTAPSSSEGFTAGGTGVLGTTRVEPGGSTVRPARQRPRRRQQVRRVPSRPRPSAAAPAATPSVPGDAAPAASMPGTVPR